MTDTTNTAVVRDTPVYVKVFENLMNLSNDERNAYDLEMEYLAEKLRPCRVDFSKPLPEPIPLISIDNSCICSRGNISAIVGEAKSKKTFLCSAIVASAIAFAYPDRGGFENITPNFDRRVVWLDTEQGEHHVRKVVKRMNIISGATRTEGFVEDGRLDVYTLREYSPAERVEVLRDSIRHDKPDIVVIDGIADLIYDTNDLKQSDAIVSEIMALSTQYNCHIICVLHTNPGSDKARGHLGSSLQRKCETVIYVHKVGDISLVEPQFCRNEPFERFAFKLDSDAIPILCALPDEKLSFEEQTADVVRSVYGGAIERQVLISKLVSDYGLTLGAAKMRVCRAVKCGALLADDKMVRLPGQ